MKDSVEMDVDELAPPTQHFAHEPDDPLEDKIAAALVTVILPQLNAFLVTGSRGKTLGDDLAAKTTRARG